MSRLVSLSSIVLLIALVGGVLVTPGPVLAQADCSALAPHLSPGQDGRVLFTDGDPLNVRGGPGREEAILARLPEGALFRVVAGPVCAGHLNWWQIEGEVGGAGWIAEGADGVYFVEPVPTGQPTADAALLAQLAALDPTTTLVLVEDGQNLVLTDLTLNPRLTVEGVASPRVTGPQVTFAQNAMRMLTGVAGPAWPVTIPTHPLASSPVALAVSPAGDQIAWLFEGPCSSAKVPARSASRATRQFCTRNYAVVLTTETGAQPRELWQGTPLIETPHLLLEGWRADSGAVFLRSASSFAFPEPGSDPDAQQGYAPQGSQFVELSLDGQLRPRSPNNLEGAISPDGRWVAYDDGARYAVANAANTLRVEAEDGPSYAIPFTDGLSLVRFSPDSRFLTWADLTYDSNYILTDAVFKALDLETGTVSALQAFSGLAEDLLPEDLPTSLTWLAADLMVVRHHERLFVLDVAGGGSTVWLPDLPADARLIGVLLGAG